MEFFNKLFHKKTKLEKEREILVFELNRINKNKRNLTSSNRKNSNKKRRGRFKKIRIMIKEEAELPSLNEQIKEIDIKLAFELLKPYLNRDEIQLLTNYLLQPDKELIK